MVTKKVAPATLGEKCRPATPTETNSGCFQICLFVFIDATTKEAMMLSITGTIKYAAATVAAAAMNSRIVENRSVVSHKRIGALHKILPDTLRSAVFGIT